MAGTVRRTIEIPRGVEEVFTYFSDFARTEEWDPGTRSTTRRDPGPVEVGATWDNVSEFRGRETELVYVLTEKEPHRHLLFTGTNKTVTSTDDMTFSGDATRTTMTYVASLDLNGLAKLAGPFLKKGFERVADDTVEQIGKALGT